MNIDLFVIYIAELELRLLSGAIKRDIIIRSANATYQHYTPCCCFNQEDPITIIVLENSYGIVIPEAAVVGQSGTHAEAQVPSKNSAATLSSDKGE